MTLIETEGVWWWCDGGLKSPSNSLRQDLLLWPGVFVSWGLFFEMGYKGDSLKWIQSVSPHCKCETVTLLVFSCGPNDDTPCGKNLGTLIKEIL